MESRFRLRFESGDRRGEEVALAGARVTIGRNATNDLPLRDASVSGRHAELVVDGSGVRVRDLGSTNGTRVGGARVDERSLAHGDRIRFGQIEAVLVDAALADEPALGTAESGSDDARVREVREIGAERVRASARRSPRMLAALAVLLVAAGGVAWLRLGGGGSVAGGGRARAAVKPVPGNLLADGWSFEGELANDAWSSAEAAPVSFHAAPAWAISGQVGYGVELLEGEWAGARSREVVVRPRRALALRARVASEGAAEVRVGIRFGDESGEAPPILAWGGGVAGDAEPTEVELLAGVPGGYDRATAVVRARARGGEGAASVDDVALVQEGEPSGAGVAHGDFELALFGDPPLAATLVHIDRAPLRGFAVHAPRAPGPEAWGTAALEAEPTEEGVRIAFPDASEGDALSFVADAELALAGLASTGPSGYQSHQRELERDDVEAILFGSGLSILRVAFEQPSRVRARHLEGGGESGLACEVALGGARSVEIQLSFREDRAAAQALARDARAAEREGELGTAIARWGEMLVRFPFEETLVAEANERRASLVQSGLEEVRALEAKLARASFFGLAELYRQEGARAREIRRRYAGSEVAEAADALVREVEAEVARLTAGRDDPDRRRLSAVLDYLERSDAPILAEEVRASLEASGEGASADREDARAVE